MQHHANFGHDGRSDGQMEFPTLETRPLRILGVFDGAAKHSSDGMGDEFLTNPKTVIPCEKNKSHSTI